MTGKTRELLDQIDALPEDEQEEIAAALLARLRRRKEEQATEEPEETSMYASFQVLKDAHLELSPDASEIYEEELYGRD